MAHIFQIKNKQYTLWYNLENGGLSFSSAEGNHSIQLLQLPGSVRQARNFKPECLTLFLNHNCNLSCSYCYVPDKKKYTHLVLDPDAAFAAAVWIAQHNFLVNKPLIFGFHGANEPLLNPKQIQKYLDLGQRIAHRYKIVFQAYCTTNGAISSQAAEWAGRVFNSVTVSCDGLPEQHDLFRRKTNGDRTSAQVQRTIRILKQSGCGLRIRATISRATVNKLSEMVAYFAQIGVKSIDMYPVYQNQNGSISNDLIPDKWDFVVHFLLARQKSRALGIELNCSASRPGNVHAQFCYVLQKNLALTPDGFLTNCFLATHNSNHVHEKYIWGSFDKESQTLHIDQGRLDDILAVPGQLAEQCTNCFNQTHCSRGCPALCPFSNNRHQSFDCRWLQWLGLANLLEAANIQLPVSSGDELINFLEQWQCIPIEA